MTRKVKSLAVSVRRRISQHESVRRAQGYLLTQLANRLAFSHGYVSRVEAGQKAASKRYQEAFARLVGMEPESVFDEDGWVK